MVDKILKISNITEFEDKIKIRLNKNKLQFGNKLQLAEIKILNLISDLKYNEDKFISCDFCNDKISLLDIRQLEGYDLCDNCINNNYMICNDCGEFVYNEDIQILDNEIYCKKCYFKVKQEIYKEHKIVNPLLKKLQEILTDDIDLFKIEFKIDKNLYNIEIYSGSCYRLGSFNANCWVDIGNNKQDLIRAVDYNLGNNRDKLTAIYLDDNREIEL